MIVKVFISPQHQHFLDKKWLGALLHILDIFDPLKSINSVIKIPNVVVFDNVSAFLKVAESGK
jgi:hypothetical protein